MRETVESNVLVEMVDEQAISRELTGFVKVTLDYQSIDRGRVDDASKTACRIIARGRTDNHSRQVYVRLYGGEPDVT